MTAPIKFSTALVSILISLCPTLLVHADQLLSCGNLIYGGKQTSVCFSNTFLTDINNKTTIRINPKFKDVKLSSSDVFKYPFAVFSGEDDFRLSETDRENLKKYITLGGFILASPSCSNADWDKAFRRELEILFPKIRLERIPMSHPIFSLIYDVPKLHLKKGSGAYIEGLFINNRLCLVYSKDGLNDVSNAKGCCCCGGNEIKESKMVNVNIFTHALIY